MSKLDTSAANFAAFLNERMSMMVRAFVKEHGRAMGFHRFARLVGITPRRARALYERRAKNIRADEYLATVAACEEIERRAAAALARAAAARAELDAFRKRGGFDAMAPVHPLDLQRAGCARRGADCPRRADAGAGAPPVCPCPTGAVTP